MSEEANGQMKKAFLYHVRTDDGETIMDRLEADDAGQAAAYLHEKNYWIISIKEEGRAWHRIKALFPDSSVRLTEISLFCRQLAMMTQCGLPLANAVKVLAEQTNNASFKKIIVNIHGELTQGKTLTEAMNGHRRVFSPLLLQMIAAGEASGTLDEILSRMAQHMEKENKIREKVKTAMLYPLFILSLGFLMAMVMLFFVLPVFTKIFASAHMTLPLPTRILLEICAFVQNAYWLIFFTGSIAAIAAIKFFSLPRNRLLFDRCLLRLPLIGVMMMKAATARFARTLGIMLRGGIPLTEALSMSKNVVGNRFLSQSLAEAEKKVSYGFLLSTVLGKEKVFPPMVVQMVAVGEETGRLDVLLEKAADFYENDAEEFAARLNSLLEPLLLLFMGVGVGAVIISVALPIFDSVMCGIGG